MTAERFTVVAPLPSAAGWRRVLAIDHAGPPQPVAVSFAPPEVTDDAARLAAVSRDAEVAARLHHRNVVSVLGLETVGDAIALVEAWRPAVSLRALLDQGGRLPADVAARVVATASAAVARAHALDAGDGRPLVHGALDPAHVSVGEDGAALVSGFGLGIVGADAAGDVRALGAVLHEALTGDAPARPPRRIDEPGVPEPLAAVVHRALEEGFPSASALAEAIAAAVPLAPDEAVGAYADAIVPADEGERAALALAAAGVAPPAATHRRAEPSKDDDELSVTEAPPVEEVPLVLDAPPAPEAPRLARAPRSDAAPVRPGASPVAAAVTPAPEGVKTFPRPTPARARSRAPLAVGLVCAALGFGGGFVAARSGLRIAVVRDVASTAPPIRDASTPASSESRTAVSASPAATATSSSTPTSPSTSTSSAAEDPVVDPSPQRGDGEGQKTSAALRKDAGKRSKKPPPRRAGIAAPKGQGVLSVSAPAEAVVFLDGRKLGTGTIRREIPEGPHRIEVRLGEASVAEQFDLLPGETWTYDVTPSR